MRTKALNHTNQINLLWGLFFCLLVLSCTKPKPFPTQLIGRWETDVESYEDRFITIREKALIFGTGELESEVLLIKSYKSTPQGSSVLWVFNCEAHSEKPLEISLIYHPDEEHLKLQMKNNSKLRWYMVEE